MKHNTYDILFEKQDGKCALCNEPLTDSFHTHIDHIVRRREGGDDETDNLRLICLPCDWEREGNAPNSQYPELKTAYKMYKTWQTERDRMDKKIKACQGDTQGTTRSPYFDADTILYMMAFKDQASDLEKMYAKEVKQQLKSIPVYKQLKSGWGAGELVLAHIMSCYDIRRGDTVSSLWKFFGFTPEDSAGAKGRNPGRGVLRAPIYAALSISLIRTTSPYRSFYDTAKARIAEKHKRNGKKISGHGQALQRTIKLWLSHLWDTWRRAEGLPVTEPYAKSQLGHDGFISPLECGWPAV